MTSFYILDIRFLPLEYLDVSGNKIDGVVPPLLCLKGGINDNGNNNDFNCDIISCPAGTWSPIGRATTLELINGKRVREHSCEPCKKSHTFLGSRECRSDGALPIDPTFKDAPAWIHMSDRDFVALLTLPLLGACLMIACATGVILRRRKQMLLEESQADIIGPRRMSLRHSKHESTEVEPSTSSDDLVKEEARALRRSSLRQSIGGAWRTTWQMSIGRYGNSERQSNESSRTVEDCHDSPRNLEKNWQYETDDEDEEDQGVLFKKIGAKLPYDKDSMNESNTSSFLSRVDDEMQYSLDALSSKGSEVSHALSSPGKDKRSRRGGKAEGDEASSHTSSRSRGSQKNSRLSKQAEKWLDVPDPM